MALMFSVIGAVVIVLFALLHTWPGKEFVLQQIDNTFLFIVACIVASLTTLVCILAVIAKCCICCHPDDPAFPGLILSQYKECFTD